MGRQGFAATLVLPLASSAEQDGTFVNVQGRMQRVSKALDTIEGRKTEIDAATFVAEAVGAKGWKIRNWVGAFNELKKHTDLLKNVKPLELGPWGIVLESEELEKARKYLIGSYALNFDTSTKIAAQLVRIQVDELGIDYMDRRNGLVAAVTPDDAARVARRLYGDGRLLVTVVGRPASAIACM